MCVRTNCSFKLSTTCLILISIVHIVGFMIPLWSTLEVSASLWVLTVSGTYHSGLWTDCGCLLFGCACFPKIYMPGWLNGVRALEALGLVGMLLSVLISFIICCCYNKGEVMRGINIFCVGASGTCIIIGVVIFGIENNEDFQNIFSFIESLPLDLDTHGKLSAGFYCCAITGGICLAVCVPLLVYDYKNPIPQVEQSVVNPVVLQYTAVNNLPVQTFINTSNPNQFGFMPASTQAQPISVQPGQTVQGAYAYTPQPGYVQPDQAVQGAYAYTPQPGYVQPEPAVQGVHAYTLQPGYVQPGPAVQEAHHTYTPQPDYKQPGQVVQAVHAYTPQPDYKQPGQVVQAVHAYTPQPDYKQPGQVVQAVHAYTPQPDYKQPGQDVERPPPYTPQDLPSASQNLHQKQDLPCKSSII